MVNISKDFNFDSMKSILEEISKEPEKYIQKDWLAWERRKALKGADGQPSNHRTSN